MSFSLGQKKIVRNNRVSVEWGSTVHNYIYLVCNVTEKQERYFLRTFCDKMVSGNVIQSER